MTKRPGITAERFRRNYIIGLGSVAGACAILALTSEKPSRGLAVVGAATFATGLYAAAAWPATKRVVSDYAAEVIADELRQLGAQVFR